MIQAQLDNRRHEMMEALYAASGRTCSTYTGLWEEFCRDIAANFRDTDYAELHAACVTAIGDTESILAEKHAQQAIAVCRRQLLGKWA
jgi:uncharacterized membrane protein